MKVSETAERVHPGEAYAMREENHVGSANHAYAPRRLTFAENVKLTIKVVAGGGLLIALLWGLNLWVSAR